MGEAAADQADPLLNIGEFARRSRLSAKALRLYDRLGVLTPDVVDDVTGYRQYRQSQLESARLIALLRRLDMPLAEIAQLLSVAGTARAELIAAYWDGVERRVASQRELAKHLRSRLSGDTALPGLFGPVAERSVPDQLVLTARRQILVGGLSDWLFVTFQRLVAEAGEYGGVVGAPFVVYHGEVNTDSDGPVEVCMPIAAALDPELGRIEPAHQEVYVRLRKAQVEYPQILSAFDTVAQWADVHRRAILLPPREIYFADFHRAGPGDEVCDVALPIR